MRQSRWERTVARGGHHSAAPENLALVPASLLPHKAIYQRLWRMVRLRLHGALGQPPRTQLVLEADAPQADAARERLARRLQAGYRIVDWD